MRLSVHYLSLFMHVTRYILSVPFTLQGSIFMNFSEDYINNTMLQDRCKETLFDGYQRALVKVYSFLKRYCLKINL
jgi:hypothetical protein